MIQALVPGTICLLLTLTWSPPSRAQGNGGDRGGGGEYAAEVLNIARGIAKKLRIWVKDGTLKTSQKQPALSESQIRDIEKIVDLDSKDRSNLLEVYSYQRVYRYPEFLPDTAKASEVTLANIYKKKPTDHPRIEVGELRWDALKGKALEKELLTLHELLGAAGILKKGERIDAAFLVSYEFKLKNLKDWENYKEELKIKAFSILSEETRLAKPPTVALKCAFDNAKNMPQYKKVMNPAKYYDRGNGQTPTASELNGFQSENYLEVLFTWVANLQDLKKNSEEELVKERKTIDAIIKEAKSKTLRKDIPDSWQEWGSKMLVQLDEAMAIRAAMAAGILSRDDVFNYIDKKCPDLDRIKTLTCLDEFAHNDLPELYRKDTESAVEDFRKMVDHFLKLLALAVSPDDIH